MSCFDSQVLTALVEGRLASKKRERTRAHVDGCASCAAAVRRIEVAKDALRSVAEWTPPPLSAAGNARLEATLRWTRVDAQPEPARPRLFAAIPRARWALAASLALAITGAGYIALHHRSHGPVAPSQIAIAPEVKPAPAPPPAPAPVELGEAAITLIAGDVRLIAPDGRSAPLDPTHRLREGDHVTTGEGARLAFQWGEGSGALLESGGELRLSKLQPRAQELAIASGRVAVRVGPHQPGESMRVRSPDHDVTVHGTWFIVGVQPHGTVVEVLEGVVEVNASTGNTASTRLPAPSRAVFRRGSGVAETEGPLTGREAAAMRTQTELGLLAFPNMAALLEGNGLLHVSSDPAAELVVDGVPFGATPLSLLRPRGRHLVELSRAGFDTVRRWVSVGYGVGELSTALRAADPKIESVAPGPREVQEMVASRRRQVSACYEHALKRNPDLAGTITLKLHIGPAGQVLGTRVGDDTLHDGQVSECLRHEAAGWLFGSARNATVVYPFVFRAP